MPPPAAIREESRWIMFCLDHKHPPLTTLHQIQLSSKPSNTQLFQRLSKEYERKREPYTFLTIRVRPFWRKVKAVHFVRFMALGPRTAQIQEMHSVPTQTSTWEWNRREGINASTMALLLQSPDRAGELCEGWSVYDYIPKIRCPLSTASVGWGLYVEEGVSRESKMMCVAFVLTILWLLEALGFVLTGKALGIIVVSVKLYYVGGIVAAALVSD
jgi:hypothetical protein